MSAAPRDTALIQECVSEVSSFAGRMAGEAPLPEGAVVVSVERGSHLIFPEPDTMLASGDVLSIVAAPNRTGSRRALGGTDDKNPPRA